MSYTPYYPDGWKDWPDVSTPITSAALSHIESGIENAGGSVEVTDGTHTVSAASEIDFTSGATVTDAGSGVAQVSINPGLSSPLTTKGDLWGFDTSNNRIPVGSNGQVLTVDSTQSLGVKWAAAADGDTLNTVASSTSTLTINEATADVWDITLTANCTFTLSSVTSSVPISLFLVLRQDATGSRTITWPSSVSWVGGHAPVIQTAAGAVDFVTLYTEDGGTTWYGWYESGGGPGSEIGYDQVTSNVSVTSTTESAGTTVISCAAHTFDGGPVMAEFFCPQASRSSANASNVAVCLFEGTTEIAQMCRENSDATGGGGGACPLIGRYRFTPSAGSHTYTVTAFEGGGTATLRAGAGGTAALAPMYIRFTKV